MKVFRLPANIRALAFDMDLTLYTSPEYGKYQNESLITRLGKVLGRDFDDMNREVKRLKEEWALERAQERSGKVLSLSNILARFGIGMEENIRWREEIYEPGRFIKKDTRLKETLDELSRVFKLGVVTNNPVSVARKTLAVLGVVECFPVLVGLDTCMIAKPHKAPFIKFAELSGVPAGACVSVGDRYEIDIELPLEMGMGGILVDGVEDVYELPGLLLKQQG